MKKHGVLLNAATDELIFREGHCIHPGTGEGSATIEETRRQPEEVKPKTIL